MTTPPTPAKRIPQYRAARINEEHTKTYSAIVAQLNKERRYRRPGYSERDLSEELEIPIRHIAAIINSCTGDNFRALINGMRLHDACLMLRQKRYAHYNVEEIGLLAGFASRQAFYIAFNRAYGYTPRSYRKRYEARWTSEAEAATDTPQ